MQLKRKEKEELVTALKDKIKASDSMIVTEYQGLTVSELNELRSKLRKLDCEYTVYKNTLCKKAMQDMGLEEFAKFFAGPTAITFKKNDPVGVAKVLTDFGKDHAKLKIKVGMLGEKVLTVSEIEALAKLPSKEVLIAMLLGTLQAPMTGLVNVMQGNARNLVYALEAIRKQKEAA